MKRILDANSDALPYVLAVIYSLVVILFIYCIYFVCIKNQSYTYFLKKKKVIIEETDSRFSIDMAICDIEAVYNKNEIIYTVDGIPIINEI
jgi:hypothetical protein